MFIMFENLIIYLNILLCTCAPLPNNNEISTDIDFEHQVQRELSPIKDTLNKITDPLTNNDEKVELKGEIQGAIKKIIERALEAAVKADGLLIERGALEKELLIQREALEKEKNDSLHKLKTLTIPLVFRNYVNKIEDKFPTKATVPQNVMRNQQFHKDILQRKYDWMDILSNNDNSNDAHVKLIKRALKEKFFSEENITVEKEIQDLAEDQKQKYSEFLENFCEGIAVSVDYVDRIVAHNEFGRYPGNDLLNVFEKAYDEYVSLFYYAVVGSSK